MQSHEEFRHVKDEIKSKWNFYKLLLLGMIQGRVHIGKMLPDKTDNIIRIYLSGHLARMAVEPKLLDSMFLSTIFMISFQFSGVNSEGLGQKDIILS